MGTTMAPVAGSGSCPAWMQSVAKPMAPSWRRTIVEGLSGLGPHRFVQPGEVRGVAGVDRQHDRLGQLVWVQRQERLPQRLEAVAAGLDHEETLLVVLHHRALPAVERSHSR